MNVCFLPADFDAPGCYRCLFPAREMRARGHAAAMPRYEANIRTDGSLLIRFDGLPRASDLFILHQRKEGGWAKAIRGLQKMDKKFIYDLDDYYLDIPDYNIASQHVGQDIIRAMNAAIRSADAVTVSTPFLAEAYGRFNDDVTVLRNVLDWEMWESVPLAYEADRPLRIGWTGGAKWRGGDIQILLEAAKRFLADFPDAQFVSVGGSDLQKELGLSADRYIQTPHFHWWKDRMAYAQQVAEIDIGLVPLVRNDFNEAKSHLKGLDYAAAGIPCLATPTESYRWFVRDGVDGFLCDDVEGFYDSLCLLASDPDTRRLMGRRARKKAERHTIQANVEQWEEVYERFA